MTTQRDRDRMPTPPAARDDEDCLDQLARRHVHGLPARPPEPPPEPPGRSALPGAPTGLPVSRPVFHSEHERSRPVEPEPPRQEPARDEDGPEAGPMAPAAAEPAEPPPPTVRLAVRAPRRPLPPIRTLVIHIAVVVGIIAVTIWLCVMWW